MPEKTAKYRLREGKTHRIPNPDYQQDVSEPGTSHIEVGGGTVLELTESQFKAFHDKFVPVGTGATDVRDEDAGELEEAKLKAAKTKENVNPNAKGTPADPFSNARPTA